MFSDVCEYCDTLDPKSLNSIYINIQLYRVLSCYINVVLCIYFNCEIYESTLKWNKRKSKFIVLLRVKCITTRSRYMILRVGRSNKKIEISSSVDSFVLDCWTGKFLFFEFTWICTSSATARRNFETTLFLTATRMTRHSPAQ